MVLANVLPNPTQRCLRRFCCKSLVPPGSANNPTKFQSRPAFRIPHANASNDFSASSFNNNPRSVIPKVPMTQHKRDVIPCHGDIARRRVSDDAAPHVRVVVNFHHGLRIACLWAAKDEPRSNKRGTQFHAFSPRQAEPYDRRVHQDKSAEETAARSDTRGAGPRTEQRPAFSASLCKGCVPLADMSGPRFSSG